MSDDSILGLNVSNTADLTLRENYFFQFFITEMNVVCAGAAHEIMILERFFFVEMSLNCILACLSQQLLKHENVKNSNLLYEGYTFIWYDSITSVVIIHNLYSEHYHIFAIL